MYLYETLTQIIPLFQEINLTTYLERRFSIQKLSVLGIGYGREDTNRSRSVTFAAEVEVFYLHST